MFTRFQLRQAPILRGLNGLQNIKLASVLFRAGLIIYSSLFLLSLSWDDLDIQRRVGPGHLSPIWVGYTLEERLEIVSISLNDLRDSIEKITPAEHFKKRSSAKMVDGFSQVSKKIDGLSRRVAQLKQRSQAQHAKIEDALHSVEKELGLITSTSTRLLGLREGWANCMNLLFGTDRQGRSIFIRSLVSFRVALLIGVVSAFCAVSLGSILGALAGAFGGWVDLWVSGLLVVTTSIPYILWLLLLAFVFSETPYRETLIPLWVAFALCFWTASCRLVRGEVMHIKASDYVLAARQIGRGQIGIMTHHILPNVQHHCWIQYAIVFISAIKSEVVLTYLGLGITHGVSWGVMLSEGMDDLDSGYPFQFFLIAILMMGLIGLVNGLVVRSLGVYGSFGTHSNMM